jgi:hypothetical protein
LLKLPLVANLRIYQVVGRLANHHGWEPQG